MFIKSITDPKEAEGTIHVILADERGQGEECLVLSLGEYKRLSASLGRALAPTEEVDEALYDRLKLSAEKTAALREGARILSRSDKSARSVARKLKEKGYGAEAVDHAVSFLQKKGYLNEEDACLRIAQSVVRSKRYGKRRLLSYLLERGYEKTVASRAAEAISDEEYAQALAYWMDKKVPVGAQLTREEREKQIAAMMRYGFSASEVLAALKERE